MKEAADQPVKRTRGAQKGNKNGAKEKPLKVIVPIRCLQEERQAYEAAASSEGLTLSEWMRRVLREKVGFQEK